MNSLYHNQYGSISKTKVDLRDVRSSGYRSTNAVRVASSLTLTCTYTGPDKFLRDVTSTIHDDQMQINMKLFY